MNKVGKYCWWIAAALLFCFSDVSKYCRHQLTAWKFKPSLLEATANSIQPMPQAASADSADYLPLPEVSQTNGYGAQEYDAATLAQAAAVMDSSVTPTLLSWETLQDVKYKKKYNKEYEQYFEYPVFGARIKALSGKPVRISGYIIPLDVGLYALSKNPYSSCFFCGGAGPETIMTLVFKSPPSRFKTDAYVTLTGMFQLNDNNVESFMYQLLAAEVVK